MVQFTLKMLCKLRMRCVWLIPTYIFNLQFLPTMLIMLQQWLKYIGIMKCELILTKSMG